MIEKFNSADEWIEKYEALTDEGRYEFLKETVQNELLEEFLEEADIVDALISLKEYLIDRAGIEEVIELVDIINVSSHNLYEEIAPYLFSEIISYYLLKNNIDKVEHYLQPFLKNPMDGIDEFLDVIYYNQCSLNL